MDFLNEELFGGYTIKEVALAVLAVLVVLFILKQILGRGKKRADYLVDATCPGCGWSGKVSKFNRVCKQCNGRM